MIGEQKDRALAFALGVIELEEGWEYGKIMTMEYFMTKVGITRFSPLPRKVLDVFKSRGVYVRKLKNQNNVRVWWQTEPAHGRGVKKNANM